VALVKQERDVGNSRSGAGYSVPTADQLRTVLQDFAGQRAGLVLIYAHAPQPGQGQGLVPQAVARLHQAIPDTFTDPNEHVANGTIYEPFDYIDGAPTNYGQIRLQMYFIPQQDKACTN
jgi:hypothetical protein